MKKLVMILVVTFGMFLNGCVVNVPAMNRNLISDEGGYWSNGSEPHSEVMARNNAKSEGLAAAAAPVATQVPTAGHSVSTSTITINGHTMTTSSNSSSNSTSVYYGPDGCTVTINGVKKDCP